MGGGVPGFSEMSQVEASWLIWSSALEWWEGPQGWRRCWKEDREVRMGQRDQGGDTFPFATP